MRAESIIQKNFIPGKWDANITKEGPRLAGTKLYM